MTQGFRWHDCARLYGGSGDEVLRPVARGLLTVGQEAANRQMPPPEATSGVYPDSPQGLAAAIGDPAFRIGAVDQPFPAIHDQPVFETLTSGSTGQPRRIRRTQASWIASFSVGKTLGIGPDARVATLGRLIHSLSLYAAVEGIFLGAEVHLLAGLRPDRQSEALVRRKITHIYATPAQLRLLADCGGPCPDLRLILIGGSKLDASLRGALPAFAPNAQIREFYGSAETSFISLADATTPDTSVGRPYPDVELALDPSGEVWVRSPYLFLGYAEPIGPLATEGSVQPATRWRDGWLTVGEIGALDENGFLSLKGRAGRMVTVADQNVFPEAIEALLLDLPGVTRAAVLPVADARRGTVLIAVVQGDPTREAAILSRLRHELGALIAPKRLIWRQDWPVLASGKTDLRALEAAQWPA